MIKKLRTKIKQKLCRHSDTDEHTLMVRRSRPSKLKQVAICNKCNKFKVLFVGSRRQLRMWQEKRPVIFYIHD